MSRSLLETVMGAVVLTVAGGFLTFAYSKADLHPVQGYQIAAQFDSVGGLSNGADVRINGIKVGTVLEQTIDPQTFRAVVKMSIRPDIKLPVDTIAAVDSEGLLGGKLVKLIPGHSKDRLAANGTLSQTKTYRALEDLVGEIIFLATDDGSKSGGTSSTGTAAPAGVQ